MSRTLSDQLAVAQAESKEQTERYEKMKKQDLGLKGAYNRWEKGWRPDEHESGYHSAQPAASFDDRELDAGYPGSQTEGSQPKES